MFHNIILLTNESKQFHVPAKYAVRMQLINCHNHSDKCN